MKLTRRSVAGALAVLGCASAPPAGARDAGRPRRTHRTEVLLEDWQDRARNRTLPVKVFAPVGTTGPLPVVIFSHGMGGSREGGGYIGEHLAAHGYVAVHVQHPGTDESVWQGQADRQAAMRRALQDPQAIEARLNDPRFIIDELHRAQAAHPKLRGRLDLARIGMSGHSFGAITTLAAVGQRMGPRLQSVAEPRIKAAIVYSPSAPRGVAAQAALESVRTPIFHFTGTQDLSLGDGQAPETRPIPFRTIRGADQYLLVFRDGDHAVFSGRRRGPRVATDAAYQEVIKAASLAFWDAYLAGDAQARAWLQAPDGLKARLGAQGVLEFHP